MENNLQKYNSAIQGIKEKKSHIPSKVSLNHFRTEGTIISSNDHNITGKEANENLIIPLQKTLISIKNGVNNLFDISKDVYTALDCLDDAHLKEIRTTSNEAKAASNQAVEASNQAKEASNKAFEASNEAKSALEKIEKTVNGLEKTILYLQEFKSKVNRDFSTKQELSSQTNIININIQQIIDRVKGVRSTLEEHRNKFHFYKDFFDEVKQFETTLKSFAHLGDIDAMWKDVEGHKVNLSDFHRQVDAFISETHSVQAEINNSISQATERVDKDIAALQQYRSILESYAHLGDIDAIWQDVEGHKVNLLDFHKQVDAFISETHSAQAEIKQSIKQATERIDNDIADFHRYVDNLALEIHGTEDSIKQSIQQLEEANRASHQTYEKRIKTAYYIGGGAVGLTVINIILQLLGIL